MLETQVSTRHHETRVSLRAARRDINKVPQKHRNEKRLLGIMALFYVLAIQEDVC